MPTCNQLIQQRYDTLKLIQSYENFKPQTNRYTQWQIEELAELRNDLKTLNKKIDTQLSTIPIETVLLCIYDTDCIIQLPVNF